MADTMQEIINAVTMRVSQVYGDDVQLYSEDRMAEMVQYRFDQLFLLEFWPQFRFRNTYTLDGSTGVVTSDLSTIIKDPIDLRYIWHADYGPDPLPELSHEFYTGDIASGDTPRFYEFNGDATKVFKVWPEDATGSIQVSGRTRPDKFILTDTINFDRQALILGTTVDYLSDDGTNPTATDDFKGMYIDRVDQLRKLLRGDKSLDPHSKVSATKWHESG